MMNESYFSDPFMEWVVVAEHMAKQDEDATLFDLIKVMYEYKTGCDFPEMPDEETTVELHLEGHSKREIADELSCSLDTVDDILSSIGFTPFKTSLGLDVFSIKDFLENNTYDSLEESYGVSYYMANKALDELSVWGVKYG